jgi:hypothetical protein
MLEQSDASSKGRRHSYDIDEHMYSQIATTNDIDVSPILLQYKQQQTGFIQFLYSQLNYDEQHNTFSAIPTKKAFNALWDHYYSNIEETKETDIPYLAPHSDYTLDIKTDFLRTFREYGINKISDGNSLTTDYEVGLGAGEENACSQTTPHIIGNDSEPYPDIIKPKGMGFISDK